MIVSTMAPALAGAVLAVLGEWKVHMPARLRRTKEDPLLSVLSRRPGLVRALDRVEARVDR